MSSFLDSGTLLGAFFSVPRLVLQRVLEYPVVMQVCAWKFVQGFSCRFVHGRAGLPDAVFSRPRLAMFCSVF